MSTVAAPSPREILDKSPAELFPGSPSDVKSQFRRLATIWHPDVCRDPQAGRVFQYLERCRDIALGKSRDGRRVFHRASPGRGEFSVDFLTAGRTDFGELLVSQSNVCYVVPDSMSDLARHALARRWKFADKKMETEMSRHLPRSTVTEKVREGHLMCYRRSRDEVLLSDLMAFERTRGRSALDYRDVMWIVSSLLNVCCYLEISKTAHCALLPEFIVADLGDHSVGLVGPPLFATPFGQRPEAVPSSVISIFPRLRSPDFRVEDSRLDLTLVRSLALKLLGHTNSALVARDSALPEGLRRWLTSPAPSSAVKDYIAWDEARGKRSFHEYGTTAREVYDALRV